MTWWWAGVCSLCFACVGGNTDMLVGGHLSGVRPGADANIVTEIKWVSNLNLQPNLSWTCKPAKNRRATILQINWRQRPCNFSRQLTTTPYHDQVMDSLCAPLGQMYEPSYWWAVLWVLALLSLWVCAMESAKLDFSKVAQTEEQKRVLMQMGSSRWPVWSEAALSKALPTIPPHKIRGALLSHSSSIRWNECGMVLVRNPGVRWGPKDWVLTHQGRTYVKQQQQQQQRVTE